MRLINTLLLVLFWHMASWAQQADAGFARYLQQTGQYDLAALEYERLLFESPSNDSLALPLIATYRQAQLLEKSLRLGQQRFERATSDSLRWIFQREMMHSSLLLRNTSQISILSTQMSLTAQSAPEKFYARQMGLGSSLLSGKPLPHAQVSLLQPAPDGLLQQYVYEWEFSKRKSPALAAGLSAVLPGSGKVYAGAWKDGLISFLFVGANAFSAYRGFNSQGIRSPYGWLFGGLSAGFYLGNIYGAHRQARKYNGQLEHRIKEKTHARLLDFHR